jgi:hypothetical protein
MASFSYEHELVEPVTKYFQQQSFSVCQEIRIGFCRADLIAYDEKTVIAVELKLRDWKKAIIQAKNYQLGAEYVYLVFPLKKSYLVMRKAEHELRKEGIGLLVVHEENEQVQSMLVAQPSKRCLGTLNVTEIQRQKRRRLRQSLLRSF